MPHKHRVKNADASAFNLPPATIAKPLPVGKSTKSPNNIVTSTDSTQSKSKRKRLTNGVSSDDTPKAFMRLMAFQKTGKGRSGLDNGNTPRGKKRKLNQDTPDSASAPAPAEPVPTILPGERLSDFAARVDQALPVAGLARKARNVPGMKERQTRMEKRLQRMQAEWRKEEARLREKEEEARELAEEEEDEQATLFEDRTVEIPATSKRGKRKRLVGEQGDDDGDPWAVLKTRREQPKGLHDVAQAPPQFKSVPKEKFKVRNGAKVQVADIPTKAGSLRWREELGETRKSIIEGYRRMMESKRGGE